MGVEKRLSDVLSEFAHTLVTDFPIQAILDRLVLSIVDVLPITAAGVTLITPGAEPRYVAASDEAALCFERLQTELDEGPCVAAYISGDAIAVPDLDDDERFPRFRARAIEEGLAAVFTFPLRHGGEQLGALDLYRDCAGPLDDEAMAAAQTLADVAAAYLLNAQARADLRDASDRARNTALHDGLTGLPNRSLLIQRLDHAIARGRRSGKTVGILYADLDQFKQINDSYGHHVGDQLLVAVAERLSRLLRPGDTLARLGGDEFVILCEDLNEASEVNGVADRICTALADPFLLDGVEMMVSASVGVAFSGYGDDVPEQVLEDADTAMYQAKRSGGARHQVIDLRDQYLTRHRASLNRALHDAIAMGELSTMYQPIVATRNGRVTGVEALLRWSHPEHGSIAPETAVSLAEQSGVISEIGRWVLLQACLDRRQWHRSGRDDELEISVNVSPRQLVAPDFSAIVAGVLAETGTDPALVTLEVTESIFVQDGERALIVLNELKQLGVNLALDDFGSGYSSLSYLRRFPVDTIKIDQGFISQLGRDRASRLIVDAVVGLAHGLTMTVVAEGVETSEQRREVAALGCEFSQGYYFARPMAAADLKALLATAGNLADLCLPVATHRGGEPAGAGLSRSGSSRGRSGARPPPTAA